MEIENLSFPEAVAFLGQPRGHAAARAVGRPRARKKRQRLLALNRDAARFFHAQLKTPAGQPARDYLARRQLTAQTVTRFGLGFAPDTWDSLVRAMKALGYSEQELFDGGSCATAAPAACTTRSATGSCSLSSTCAATSSASPGASSATGNPST